MLWVSQELVISLHICLTAVSVSSLTSVGDQKVLECDPCQGTASVEGGVVRALRCHAVTSGWVTWVSLW